MTTTKAQSQQGSQRRPSRSIPEGAALMLLSNRRRERRREQQEISLAKASLRKAIA